MLLGGEGWGTGSDYISEQGQSGTGRKGQSTLPIGWSLLRRCRGFVVRKLQPGPFEIVSCARPPARPVSARKITAYVAPQIILPACTTSIDSPPPSRRCSSAVQCSWHTPHCNKPPHVGPARPGAGDVSRAILEVRDGTCGLVNIVPRLGSATEAQEATAASSKQQARRKFFYLVCPTQYKSIHEAV